MFSVFYEAAEDVVWPKQNISENVTNVDLIVSTLVHFYSAALIYFIDNILDIVSKYIFLPSRLFFKLYMPILV